MALPGAFEQASYGGQPSWRTKPRIIQLDSPRSRCPGRLDRIGRRTKRARPRRTRQVPHYRSLPHTCHAPVRLDAIDETEASELITESWRLRTRSKRTSG